MDCDTDDESHSAGSTSVLRVAGLAALQQMLARVFLGKLAVKAKTILSRKNRMRAQRSSYATLQEQLLGLTFEPFANLSPLFRELLPAVFLHHASPCLYVVEHGFVDDPHMDMQGSKHFPAGEHMPYKLRSAFARPCFQVATVPREPNTPSLKNIPSIM